MQNIIFTLLLSTLLSQNLAHAAECRFGKEISSLTETPPPNFQVKHLGDFVKIARAEVNGTVVRVKVVEVKEVGTDKLYHLNYTYEDEFDGGNSLGWIEDFWTLEIVAKIQDSQFYDCR
jgi:hypothetical protein